MKQAYFQLSPEKRDLILAAACAEFGAHDFDAASLDRIVSAAGISKGGLYEYIASKEELYLYCMERTWSALYAFIRDRRLTRDEVIAINHLLKSRAKRCIAAAHNDWLYPERHYRGTWTEIAQVLRHRHVGTTAIYAKVDRVALQEVAQPWPGGAS